MAVIELTPIVIPTAAPASANTVVLGAVRDSNLELPETVRDATLLTADKSNEGKADPVKTNVAASLPLM